MFKEKFGIEIEFTGITRNKASKVVAELINGSIVETRDYYDTKEIHASDGRKWKVMYDGSLRCQTKRNGLTILAESNMVHGVSNCWEKTLVWSDISRRLEMMCYF